MSEPTSTPPQTIDQVTEHLCAWAKEVTDGAPVSLAPPTAPPEALQVHVFLLDVVRKPVLRGPDQPPLQVQLRYLVSVWGPDPAAAHHALHQLVFDALARPDLEVDETPPPAALWSALGAVPRPAFTLRVRLQVERYEPMVPLVRRAETHVEAALATLHGRLLVPSAGSTDETMALSGARVEVVGTRNSALSDQSGHFRLDNVLPGEDGTLRLAVQAKGRRTEVTVHEMGTPAAPETIEVPWSTVRLEGRMQDQNGDPIAGARIELPEQRQYVVTRADGRFVLDGLPPDTSPHRLIARQGGERIEVYTQQGTVVLTRRAGTGRAPVVIEIDRS